MMEAARTSETSVDNYFTRQYIPEDKSELHISTYLYCTEENWFYVLGRTILCYLMMLFQLEELYNVDIIVLVKNTFHPCVCT
jgi:hypothetical protein